MSVSLTIRWPDGTREEVFLGTHSVVRNRWEPIARSLGLSIAGQLSEGVVVHPETISPLITEFESLNRGMERHPTEWAFEIRRVGDLLDGLRRLQSSEGWDASIG